MCVAAKLDIKLVNRHKQKSICEVYGVWESPCVEQQTIEENK